MYILGTWLYLILEIEKEHVQFSCLKTEYYEKDGSKIHFNSLLVKVFTEIFESYSMDYSIHNTCVSTVIFRSLEIVNEYYDYAYIYSLSIVYFFS